MSRGINKVILVGNLGADPEVRYAASGAPIANLRVATSESWRDKQTGQQQERTEWHRVVIFNKLAEIAGQYLRKGSKVYLEGKLQTRKWQDQQGQDRYSTEIVIDVAGQMQMLDGRQEAGGNYSQSGLQSPQAAAPAPQAGFPASQPAGAGQPGFQGVPGGAPAQPSGHSPAPQAGGAAPAGMGHQGYGRTAAPEAPQPAQAAQPAGVFDNFDDDIPF